MKSTKLFTCLILTGFSLLFIVMGCKKNNGSGGGSGISATVGGTAWQSQNVNGVNSGGSTLLSGYYGKSGDTSAIVISIEDSVKVNQPDSLYLTTLSYINNNHMTYTGGYFAGYSSSHGIVTVSSWDKNAHKIAGTFSGVLYNSSNSNDSLKVDNGHFNASYLVQ